MNNSTCFYCNEELGEVFLTEVRDRLCVSDKAWTFRQCRGCGSIILDPMPSLDELLAAYPDVYHVDEASQTHWFHRLQYALETRLFYEPIYRSSVRQVQRVTGLRKGRLLDVGGGAGHRSAFFQQAGFDVTVLDPDERALKVARERFGLKTVCGLLEDTDLSENYFDLVTFWNVIEHLPNPKLTLSAAYRVLRTGGWFIALVPLVDSWQSKIFKGRWVCVKEAPRHTALPTVKGMRRLLQGCGFTVKAQESNNIWDNAGLFALSLVPLATTSVACVKLSLPARLFWRGVGVLATFAGLPFAWLEKIFEHPGAGVFFAQKE